MRPSTRRHSRCGNRAAADDLEGCELRGSSLQGCCSCVTSMEVCWLREAGDDFLRPDEFEIVSHRDVVGLVAFGSGNPVQSLLITGDPRSVKRTMIKKEKKTGKKPIYVFVVL